MSNFNEQPTQIIAEAGPKTKKLFAIPVDLENRDPSFSNEMFVNAKNIVKDKITNEMGVSVDLISPKFPHIAFCNLNDLRDGVNFGEEWLNFLNNFAYKYDLLLSAKRIYSFFNGKETKFCLELEFTPASLDLEIKKWISDLGVHLLESKDGKQIPIHLTLGSIAGPIAFEDIDVKDQITTKIPFKPVVYARDRDGDWKMQ